MNACRARHAVRRGNAPGLVIMALRGLSQDLGFFVESEKGRQQLAIKRTVGESILNTGYCVTSGYEYSLNCILNRDRTGNGYMKTRSELVNRLGGNYKGDGPGILRKIPEETLDELKKIFEVTGGTR